MEKVGPDVVNFYTTNTRNTEIDPFVIFIISDLLVLVSRVRTVLTYRSNNFISVSIK